jgi:SEC-C motif-containing protein
MYCPCGSGKNYSACCGVFIEEKHFAPSPEALMRSRYTAYVKKDLDYIEKTAIGPARKRFNKKAAQQRVESTEWLGLDILKVSPIFGHRGFVEFIAHYKDNKEKKSQHEISEFHQKDGQWYYFSGRFPKSIQKKSKK